MPFFIKESSIFPQKMNPNDDTSSKDENKKQGDEPSSERLKNFIDNTTLHGARYVNERHPLRKLFWIACIVGALIFCAFQCTESMYEFIARPYATIVETKQEIQQKFPGVTFCNLNMMHLGKYRAHVKKKFPNTSDREIEADINFLTRNLRRKAEKVVGVSFSRVLPALDINLANRTRISSFYTPDAAKRSSLIHEMLMPKELFPCVYQNTPCDSEDFYPIHIPTYGLCYTFRPKMKNVNVTGRKKGLELVLNVGSNVYLDNGYHSKVGFVVSVHPDDGNLPNMNEGFYTLTGGVHTSCEARRKQFLSLPEPYATKCGVMKNWKHGKKKYRRHLCYFECYNQELRMQCNCSFEKTRNDGYPYCVTDSQMNCNNDVAKSMYSSPRFLACRNSCPESCDYTEYDIKLFTSSINIKSLLRDTNELCRSDLKKNEGICDEIRNITEQEKYEYFRENIVMLEVYLKDILYDEIRHVASYKECALISNIGGTLGLFLGMSILTITEIVEFALITLCNKLRKILIT